MTPHEQHRETVLAALGCAHRGYPAKELTTERVAAARAYVSGSGWPDTTVSLHGGEAPQITVAVERVLGHGLTLRALVSVKVAWCDAERPYDSGWEAQEMDIVKRHVEQRGLQIYGTHGWANLQPDPEGDAAIYEHVQDWVREQSHDALAPEELPWD